MKLLVRAALFVGLAALFAPAARAEGRRRVAVLEFRGGVQQAPGLGQRLADRLKRTAALQVLGPLEARQRIPRVDAEVARCAGDAGCIARIGAQLEVDEVLLVGMSKLGDVVLALQRIDVADAKVLNQLSEVLSDEELQEAKLGSWLKQLYPPEVFKRYGYIVVTANIEGAHVSINGQDRGDTPLESKIKVLAPRGYRVDVAKDGFTPFAARIDVPPDASVEVRAELAPESGPLPWYKRWWVWAIAGGVVAAAAIGVTVYALQPDPNILQGTISRGLFSF